ncbi:extracellular solute-binding protein [uncultured Jatrophihabitans sp.]|uniref:extracellular solute-binding protein n=1 Tax=uncultured Jatrophihabitans sp. TaxID=1610747 RepID=UPI0035C9C58C
MSRWTRNLARVGVSAAVVLGTVSACSSSSGAPTLNWYINPDNGAQATLGKECAAASGGKYKISTHILPNDASQQRQQLVTRLAAKDSSIDMMSLDPVFVAEFAEAGFLADVPSSYKADFTKDIVKPAVVASTWKNKLVAAPFWANTQLLWYRKSIAKAQGLDMSKPVTWQQLIDAASKAKKTIGVQADLYEGYTVWINALVEGAGGKIVQNPGAIAKKLKLGLNSAAGKDAAGVISQVARKGIGGPSLSTSEEAQSLAVFENPSTSAFMTIWPYVWAAMKADGVKFRDTDVGWTYYPETVAGKQSRPPFGGIEIGAGAYGSHKSLVWQALSCIRNEKHQLEYFNSSGNPAANTQVYNAASIRKAYPMASLIRSSLERAAPRPQTQYYGDLSTALQESFSPPNSVNSSTPKKAQDFILAVLKGDKLL